MDFSSSSGEEGVLTISGVRLNDWEKQNKTQQNQVLLMSQTRTQ